MYFMQYSLFRVMFIILDKPLLIYIITRIVCSDIERLEYIKS